MYFFASFHYNIQTYYICASLVLVYILNVQQISHVQSKVGVLFWNCGTRHVILLGSNLYEIFADLNSNEPSETKYVL